MTVYTVELRYLYEGSEIAAVFSSRELAEAYIASRDKFDQKYLEVSEWVLDKPDGA